RTGMIIQGSGLFPHRTVYENVATVPRLLQWPEEKTRAAASALLEKMSMPFEKFKDRRPRSLSGGEQQRVGIARAMIANPPLLLCDEPFAALDPIVRRELARLRGARFPGVDASDRAAIRRKRDGRRMNVAEILRVTGEHVVIVLV